MLNCHLIVTFLLVLPFCTADEGTLIKRLRCDLQWVEMASGDNLPDKTVQGSLGGKQFVIRTKLSDDKYYSGHYDQTAEKGYVVDFNKTLHTIMSFEILTNPHNCNTTWSIPIPIPEVIPGIPAFTIYPLFPAPVFKGTNTSFIGRTLIGNNPGHIVFSIQNPIMYYKQLNSGASAPNFQVLSSFSDGLRLDVVDFKIDMDPLAGTQDMVGMDVIRNESPATVVQTVTHRKTMIQTTTIKMGLYFAVGATVELNFDVNLSFLASFKFDATIALGASLGVGTEFSRTVETEIITKREISVPEFSTVYACSTMVMRENVTLEYAATAVYSAKGLSNEEVLNIITTIGIRGGEIKNGRVEVPADGEFSGSMVMSTKFHVNTDAEAQGCREISEEILQRKKQKFRNLQNP